MENLLSIGQMAKLNNVSVQTLRHYEKLGLIFPKHVDPKSNYRYYSILQSRQLDMIMHLKSLGMSLHEIKELLASGNIDTHQEHLTAHKKDIEKKIATLQRRQHTIDISIQNITNFNKTPKAPEVVYEHIIPRNILIYDGNYNIYEGSYSTFQFSMREFKRHLGLGHLPQPFFYNIGGIIRKKHFLELQFHASEIFIFAEKNYDYKGKAEQIPGGDYACMYFDTEHDEFEYAEILWKEIKKHNHKIVGDYIFEVMADLPIFFQDGHKMYIKIQVQIEISGDPFQP